MNSKILSIKRLWSTFIVMRIKNVIISISIVAALQLSLARSSFAETSQALAVEPVQHVVTHLSSPYEILSLNELRAIFSLRARAWPDGSKITVVVFEDSSPSHRSFLHNTLKMLPHQLRRQWDRYIYSGIGQGPVVVDSTEDMLLTINNTPGAIGYVQGGVPYEQVTTLTIR